MDQPTYLDLRITGTEQNVAQAANAAVRVIEQDSPPEFFEKRVKALLEYDVLDSNTAEYLLYKTCYWAFDEFDVDEIADAIIQASPDVEFHLSARITITCYEGYDTYVDINYVSGEKTMDVRYDEFYAEHKAQIRKILDAVDEAYAEKLADEMLHDLFDGEWTKWYADIKEAFLDAALSYETTPDDFISQMREKANELFGIVIDDDKDEDKE